MNWFFCIWYETRFQFNYFAWGYPIFLVPFIEETVLSPLRALIIHHRKSIDCKCIGICLGPLLCCIGLCVIFRSVSCYFDYCNFVVCLKIRKYDTSSFLLFAQDCLGYLGYVVVLYKFKDCFFYFCESCWWNFDRNCIESVDHFGSINVLKILIYNIRTQDSHELWTARMTWW